jgi:hypothetical protein
MKVKMLPLLSLVALFGVILISNSCGSQANCPVCGTDQNGTIGLIDVMIVPEHNPNGEPGGPFNIFDISWVDPTNRQYYVSDRIGLDVPAFSTTSNIAEWAIGGDNSVAEAGNNASLCWVDSMTGETIPPITTAQGNYTRFGCKTEGFRLPGFFGPNGHFGGFVGGQCCASRANNLNPLSGPNGLEVSGDGNFLFVGNGAAEMLVFDLAPMISSGYNSAPTLTAVIPTGSSPDYDGPTGISNCMASANGRAFSDPSCGDLRGDELASTGAVVTFPQDGSSRYLVAIINGDPGLPFVSIIDVTGVVTRTGTDAQQHCLAYSQVANPADQSPFSPGISTYQLTVGGPTITTTFPANYSSCILGQIYYDNALPTDNTVFIDEANGFACPDPSLQFYGPAPGTPGNPVPSGASGDAAGFNPRDSLPSRAYAPQFGPQHTNKWYLLSDRDIFPRLFWSFRASGPRRNDLLSAHQHVPYHEWKCDYRHNSRQRRRHRSAPRDYRRRSDQICPGDHQQLPDLQLHAHWLESWARHGRLCRLR